MSTATKRAVLIIRVSDPKQEKEGLSLDNQEQVLRQYAIDLGYEIAEEFRFQETADLKIRKRFHEMVDYVRKRSTVTAIIGYRVDRMTRNFHDHVLLDELRLHHGKELHFVHDRLLIHARSVGRDIQDWDTKVYLAKQYLNRVREDAIISGEFKVSRGERPGPATYGYLNVKREGRSWVAPDPMAAPIVVYCCEEYATGAYSMKQIRALVFEKFGVTISHGKLDLILKNRFYYGEMLYNGQIYPHIYEPLISRDLYERVMAVKQSFHKKSYKFAGLPFLYRGMITCDECGCAITPEMKKKADGRSYTYYHCTQYHSNHGAAWIREEDLTKQFLAIFEGLKIPELEIGAMTQTLRENHDVKKSHSTSARAHLKTERKKYEQRIDVLYEDRLDLTITKDFYETKRQEYARQIRDIDGRLARVDEAEEEYYLAAIYILELCARAKEAFEEATPEGKRKLLNMVLQNCKLKDKTLLWELKSPFDTVFYHVGRQGWLPLTNVFRNKLVELAVSFEEVDKAMRELAALPMTLVKQAA